MQNGNVTWKVNYPLSIRYGIHGIKGRWLDQPISQENMHLFSISVSLILAALSTHAANLIISSGCQYTSLSGSVLYATCQSSDGSDVSTSIDLNQCVANTNGNLFCSKKWVGHHFTWQYSDDHRHCWNSGNYSATCSGCGLSANAGYLVCTCNDYNQAGQYADIELGKWHDRMTEAEKINTSSRTDQCLTNSDGNLTC